MLRKQNTDRSKNTYHYSSSIFVKHHNVTDTDYTGGTNNSVILLVIRFR